MTPDKNLTCCFSGHRAMPEIKDFASFTEELIDTLRDYYDAGIRHFICGGAVGFDMIAAEAVISLKQRLPDICLTIAIPCKKHDLKWGQADKERLSRVLQSADVVHYVSEGYFRGCMHVRNRFMVDRSQYLICYLGKKSGGTYYTYGYAKEHGLKILNIYPFNHPDTGGLL